MGVAALSVTFGLLVTSAAGLAIAQESQIETLRASAKAAPADPRAALAVAHALRRAGYASEAVVTARRAVSLSTKPADFAAAYEELAAAHADRADFPQTASACKHLGDVAGASARGHVCNAMAQFLRLRAAEALTETAVALSLDPVSYDARIAEGRAYELELETAQAEASLRAAMALDPSRPAAHLALGRILAHGERRDEGIKELRVALGLDPMSPEGLFALAAALPAGDEGIALLETATRERPSYGEAWLALAAEQVTAGRLPKAKEAAQSARRVDPTGQRAGLILGQIALAEGRVDDAILAGQAVLRVTANNAAAMLLVADGDAQKGNVDRAVEEYQAAWGLDHLDPSPLVRASQACHRAGRDTSARAFAVRATQEFPAWASGWAALGDALSGQGEKAGAEDAYRKARALTATADPRPTAPIQPRPPAQRTSDTVPR